jgi:hypothetical protein
MSRYLEQRESTIQERGFIIGLSNSGHSISEISRRSGLSVRIIYDSNYSHINVKKYYNFA